MPIEDFTTQQVNDVLRRLEADDKTLAKKLEGVDARLNKLSAEKSELETKRKRTGRDIERLQAAALLLQEIPGGVRDLRRLLGETRLNAAREDITVRQLAEFRTEIGRLAKELIAACPHPFIIDCDGYKGGYGEDDHSEPGERACPICDLHEYEYSRWGGPAGYTALVPAAHRVFGRGRREELGGRRAAFQAMPDIREIIACFTDARALELLLHMTQHAT